MTIKEIVKKMNNPAITECTIRRWCNEGLKHINGRPILIKKTWVEDFIESEAERKIIEINYKSDNKQVVNKKLRKMPDQNRMKISIEDLI